MHEQPKVVKGPMGEEIVRTAGRPVDGDGNSRQIDLAWAAGFFDGEGHISIHRSRRDGQQSPSWGLQIMLAQVDKRYPPEMQRILGGKVTRYPMQGNNRAPYKYVWRNYGQAAAQNLCDMLPYLVGKREQAEVGIELQARKRPKVEPRKPLTQEESDWQRSKADQLLAIRSQIKANS